MPCFYQDKTVPELRHKCKKRGIRITKQTGGYRTKDSLIRSLIKYKKDKKAKKGKRYRRQYGGDDKKIYAVIKDDKVYFYDLKNENPSDPMSYNQIKPGETTLHIDKPGTIINCYSQLVEGRTVKYFAVNDRLPKIVVGQQEETEYAIALSESANTFNSSYRQFKILTISEYNNMINEYNNKIPTKG